MTIILTKSVNQTLFIKKKTCPKFIALVTTIWAHIAYNLSITCKYPKMTLTPKFVLLLDPPYWIVPKVVGFISLPSIFKEILRKHVKIVKNSQMYHHDPPPPPIPLIPTNFIFLYKIGLNKSFSGNIRICQFQVPSQIFWGGGG